MNDLFLCSPLLFVLKISYNGIVFDFQLIQTFFYLKGYTVSIQTPWLVKLFSEHLKTRRVHVAVFLTTSLSIHLL